ncbi:MAG: FAD:protein FMN transferase [Eubacteriaceae bacterium]|nr:FAD:protein FMN transferase [Eubacteriaceae bacterium]
MSKTALRIICLIISILIIGCSWGCSGKKQSDPISATAVLLDTVVTVTIYDSDDETLLSGCMDLVREYEQLFSRTIETSDVSRLNSRATDTVDPRTAELIEQGLYYAGLSSGRFDITIGGISCLWDFSSGSGSVPDPDLISDALPHVDYRTVSVEGTTVTFADPLTRLDLGAIAKGYIADRLKDYLTRSGVESALINLGGNTLCIGGKPGGDAFRIGVQYPFQPSGDLITVLEVSGLSIVSSGSYERYFVENGISYHHILDPSTGYSVRSGLCGVTIICASSVQADALSTICFILGEEEALRLINSLDDVWCILIRDDMSMVYSDGAEAFVAK